MSKTRTYSRRGKALRRLALLLALLVGSAVLRIGIGSYCVTPEQAMRRMESQNGVSGLTVIHTEESVGNPEGEKQIYICENENYITFNLMEFSYLSGWRERAIQLLEPKDPGQRHLIYLCNEVDTGESWFCLMGFIPEGEDPPTFRVGVYNEDAREEDSSDRLMNTVTYTPTPTIRVDGGALFFEQHTYSAPKAATPEEQEEIYVSFDGFYNGVWERPHLWCVTNT